MGEYFNLVKDVIIKNPTIGTIGIFVVGFPLYIVYKIKIDVTTDHKQNFPRTTNYDNRFKKYQLLKNNQVSTKSNGKLFG